MASRDAVDRAILCFKYAPGKSILNRCVHVPLEKGMFQALDVMVFRFKNR